jgi:methionyl-tRNA formyltransferase
MFTLYLLTQRGLETLKALLASGYAAEIDAVIVGEDKNVQHDFAGEIQQLCELHHLKWWTRQQAPHNRSPFSLAVSWRWLIDEPATTVIVLHDSLLPKYRGFNPLVTALVNGDTEIGVTALYATGEYDCGDIILKSSTTITYPIRIADAINRICSNYISIALSIFQTVTRRTVLPRATQNEADASYSLWRDEQDYAIQWDGDAATIRRFIDATGYPYLGASTFLDDRKIRILAAEERPDRTISNRAPGKVISTEAGLPVIVCGRGLILLTEVVDDITRESALPFPRFRVRLAPHPKRRAER